MLTTASVMFCLSTLPRPRGQVEQLGKLRDAVGVGVQSGLPLRRRLGGVDVGATPTSAAANAGASLIPSPTIATCAHLIDESAAASVARPCVRR